MSLFQILSQFIRRLQRPKATKPAHNLPPMTSQLMLERLMHAVKLTETREYDCEQVYELLDQYAEMADRGEDVSQIMPMVKRHLDLCQDCREEFEALLRVLQSKSVKV